jgi:hypothetical protein
MRGCAEAPAKGPTPCRKERGKEWGTPDRGPERGLRPGDYDVRGCAWLVVKAVAEFDVDFAGIVPVEAAEGLAVVEIDAAIGHVHRVNRS